MDQLNQLEEKFEKSLELIGPGDNFLNCGSLTINFKFWTISPTTMLVPWFTLSDLWDTAFIQVSFFMATVQCFQWLGKWINKEFPTVRHILGIYDSGWCVVPIDSLGLPGIVLKCLWLYEKLSDTQRNTDWEKV